MRIAVIGAGAVGGAIAARLAGAGHEVEVTARGAHLAAIREGGIRLRGKWGSIDAAVTASETLTTAPELAIVATKAQDAEAAMRANAAMLLGVPVLVIQNGLEGIAMGQRALPDSEVSGGLAMFAASFLSPGEVTITASGPTFIGGPGAAAVARVLGQAIAVDVVRDFAGAQWSKLLVNQVNALPAVTGLSAQQTIASLPLRRLLVESMRETVRAGLATGVHFASLSGLSHLLLRVFAIAPFWIAQIVPRLMARRMGPVPNPGSTLQSIKRGQRSEIDYLNGAVVAAAAAVGLETPVNARLVALVHEVERSGEFISLDSPLLTSCEPLSARER
jgi:2-dehydropantoate 2-reductase